MATFAEALVDAHERLGREFANAEQPATAISAVVVNARHALFDEGYSPAVVVGERALKSVLIATAQGDVALADATGPQAAEAWQRNRGEPGQLVQRFVSEVFATWAAHIASRDMARLIDTEQGRAGAQVRETSRALAQQVAAVAASVPVPYRAADIGAHWHELVGSIFERGRQLEPSGES